MKCPACNNLMKMRTGAYGSFWGCSTYPDCKRTVNIKDADSGGGEEKPQCLRDESFPCWDCKFRSTEHCPLLA